MHILVVDDDREILETLKYYLKELNGHKVVAVSDARSAISRIDFTNFDLLLVDYLLGGELADGVLERAKEYGIPRVVMTGFPNLEYLKEVYGLLALIKKPFDLDTLDALLKEEQ